MVARRRAHAKRDHSAVGGVDIEDFHVAVGIVDSVGEGEIADDGILSCRPVSSKSAASAIEIGSPPIAAMALRRFLRVFDGSLSRNSTTSIEMSSR